MDSEQHELLGRIFIGALAVPDEEREAWLEENTDSLEIRSEVEKLLSADQAVVPFLDAVKTDIAPHLPAHFESYELGEVIGEGGMGVVYKARQLQPNRLVAIKVLSSVYVAESLDRFKREIEILGRLEHEAVARVYDAGINERRPYIVMELVEGDPLNQFVNRADVNLPETLQLFVDVCEGVAHAHAKGVIHRDLKPSNILVAEGGHPKILDFGIARSIDEDPGHPTLQTKAGVILGTLQYMSPEQARGKGASADVRSDVYALGGILFELIEGQRPINIDGDSLSEAIQKICETPPPALSSKAIKERRDLDVIIAKAMAKEPERRYETVAALAADVGRVLANEPILARPPSAAYVFRRFARRHRVVVASAACALVIVLAVTVAAFVLILESRDKERASKDQALRLAEKNRILAHDEGVARKRAVADAENARLTMRFLLEMFEDLDPTTLAGQGFGAGAPSGDVLKASDILDRGAERLKSSLRAQPATRAYLLDAIGRVYVSLGYANRGEPLLREAYEIRQGLQPQDQAALASSLFNLGLLSAAKGERCADQLSAVLKLQQAIHGEGSEEVMTTLVHLATHLTLEDRLDEAALVFPQALELAVSLKGDDSRQAALVRLFWAELHLKRDRPLKGLALAQEAAASIDRHAGNSDFSKLLGDYIGARISMKLGQKKRAESLYVSALARCDRAMDGRHFLLAAVLSDYGLFLAEKKKDSASAYPVLNRAIEITRMRYGENTRFLVGTLTALARVCRSLGRYDEVMENAREVIRIVQNNARVPRSREAVAWAIIANEHDRAGRLDETEQALRRVIRIRRPTPKSSRLKLAIRNLAKTLLRRGGHEELIAASVTREPKSVEAALLRARSAALAHELSRGENDEQAAWICERFATLAIADIVRALEGGLSEGKIRNCAELKTLSQRSDFPLSSR